MEYLNNLSQSLSARFGDVIPGVFGALIVLIIGFMLAGIVSRIVKRILKKTSIDERLALKLNTSFRIDHFIGKMAYYLVILLTLLVVLNLLGVDSVLTPLQDMLGEFLGFIPNIIAGGIIAFAGYILAQIGSEASGFIAQRIEGYGDRVGINTGSIQVSKIVKQFVFVIIFIPILIIALDTLDMSAISEPATAMLGTMLDAIPSILAAALYLALFYVVGKFVTSFIAELLANVGMDDFSKNMGMSSILGSTKLSSATGSILFFFIMFTGIIAAVDTLELTQVSEILSLVFTIAGKVFFGVIVLLAGVFISNIAVKALSNSADNKWMIPIARFAILGIFLAFSLHTMGIAESIVNLAFGLTLGAIAVAFALSFGLGGREAAGKQMQHFFDKMKK